ncbi:MAG: hypothetical protein K8M05_37825 [Deltaproteobacteria bacterium]|nr:hypothetical protein [Kofleriaceae bacterium]
MRALALVPAAALAACGGGEDLTCDVLTDPGNCWATAAAAAKACLPAGPAAQEGLLSADRASCLFADGTRVVFDEPLPMSNDDLERFAFTVEQGTLDCARFVDTFMNRMELTAGGATVVSELHAGSEFHLHCDGGPDYEGDFGVLFTCPGNTAPTDGFQVTSTSVTFTVVSVNTIGPLFTCNVP